MGWLQSLFGGGKYAELEAAVKAEASRHGMRAERVGGRMLLVGGGRLLAALDLDLIRKKVAAGADRDEVVARHMSLVVAALTRDDGSST